MISYSALMDVPRDVLVDYLQPINAVLVWPMDPLAI